MYRKWFLTRNEGFVGDNAHVDFVDEDAFLDDDDDDALPDDDHDDEDEIRGRGNIGRKLYAKLPTMIPRCAILG
jgi:hypothetical protein